MIKPVINRFPSFLAALPLAVVMGIVTAMALPAPAQEQGQSQDEGREQTEDQEQEGESEGPPIYPNLAVRLIEMGVPVIDVRSQEEVGETGVLADADHIPHTDVDALAEFIGDDRDRAVVMYCGSGRRADRAIEALRERGFSGMVNAGGYDDLRAALEGDDGEQGGDE